MKSIKLARAFEVAVNVGVPINLAFVERFPSDALEARCKELSAVSDRSEDHDEDEKTSIAGIRVLLNNWQVLH